jgi:hypothetical protein
MSIESSTTSATEGMVVVVLPLDTLPTLDINLNNPHFRDKLPLCGYECAKLGQGRAAAGRERRLRIGRREGLNLVAQFGFLDVHVFEFAGVEYFAAFEALDEFGIFIAGNDLDTRMFAWSHILALVGRWLGRD